MGSHQVATWQPHGPPPIESPVAFFLSFSDNPHWLVRGLLTTFTDPAAYHFLPFPAVLFDRDTSGSSGHCNGYFQPVTENTKRPLRRMPASVRASFWREFGVGPHFDSKVAIENGVRCRRAGRLGV